MVKDTALLSPVKSFYAQVLRVLIPFSVGVVVLYSLLIQVAVNETEDYIIHKFLEADARRLLQEAESLQTNPQELDSAFLVDHLSTDSALPANYATLAAGAYELEDEQNHLLIAEIPHTNQRVYFIFNEESLSNIEAYEVFLDGGLFLLAFTLLILAGGVVSALIAKKLALPLERLVEELQQGWRGESPLTGSDRQDEIGELSRSLETYAEKLQEVLEREKSFTRHASHEMRTPIGVIRNSLSVIKLATVSEEKRSKNHLRIQNAVDDLEQLTNVFLLLGRSNQAIACSQVAIISIIQATLNRLDDQIKQQNIKVNIQGDESLAVSTNDQLFKVLLINLVLNAIHHGDGTIQIDFDSTGLTVENPVDATRKNEQSNHGYGLEIIERISNTLGWHFQYSDYKSSFSARIEFNSST